MCPALLVRLPLAPLAKGASHVFALAREQRLAVERGGGDIRRRGRMLGGLGVGHRAGNVADLPDAEVSDSGVLMEEQGSP